MVIIDNGEGAGPSDRLLWGIKTVVAKTGLSRASIYRYMRRGLFPDRRRIGPNRVAWVANEILAWIETRPYSAPREREGHEGRFPQTASVPPGQAAVPSDGEHGDEPCFDTAAAGRDRS